MNAIKYFTGAHGLRLLVLVATVSTAVAIGVSGGPSYARHRQPPSTAQAPRLTVEPRRFSMSPEHDRTQRSPAHDIPNGGEIRRVTFFSHALRARRHYLIYFPPGYRAGALHRRRFPVLYLLHPGPGQPADFTHVGALQATFRSELHAHRVKPMLVVMPDGHVPSVPTDAEWSNTSIGKYEDLILDTVRAVDQRWPTRAERLHRMLAGLSTGGYAAANITLHHLHTFGSFESWSGFFIEDRTEAFRKEPASLLLHNSPANYVPGLAPELRREPVRALVYQGWQDPEQTNYALFTRRARAAGIHLTAAKFPGRHDWRLWRWRMKYDLRYASAVLYGARVPRSVTQGKTLRAAPPDRVVRATRHSPRPTSHHRPPTAGARHGT